MQELELFSTLEGRPSRIHDRGVPIVDLEDSVDELGAGWSRSVRVPPLDSRQSSAIRGKGATRLVDRSQERAEVRVLHCGRERLVAIFTDAHRGRMPYRLGIQVLG